MELKKGFKHSKAGIIPLDWEDKLLSDIILRLVAGISVNSIDDDTNVELHEKSILKTSSVENGKFIPHECKRIAPKDIQRAKLNPRTDTILISRMNTIDLVGECGYVSEDYPFLFLPDRLWMTCFRPECGISAKWLSYILSSNAYRMKLKAVATGTSGSMKNISKGSLFSLAIPFPNQKEQGTIAEALSDVDALIESLDKLIAKKRDIKQAAMQQLLTGKIRLPGFHEDWQDGTLGDGISLISGHHVIARYCNSRGNGVPYLTGPSDFPNGIIQHTKFTERPSTLCQTGDILVTVKGSGSGKLVISDAIYCISRQLMAIRVRDWDCRFIFYSLLQNASQIKAASTGLIPGLSRSDILGQSLPLPPRPEEQVAIADILCDMEAEITALEQKRDKTRLLKQGMMQVLLTGRIRLPVTEAVSDDAPEALQKAKDHNWQINEAVVISVLAKQFGSKEYPLGRKRYTKLAYLLHRHAEKQAEGYLKKSAGPYNPKTRYGGPEKIALDNRYVCEHKSDKCDGFIPGDNIAQAEQYFDKWYGCKALQWLEQFRFKKNDDLELLATVDMAAEDLQSQGKDVSVATVKALIESNKEWKAKLSREVFSDNHIATAIKTCQTMFG